MGALGCSDAELLMDTASVIPLPSEVFHPFQPHDFQGKGTVCHSVSLPTVAQHGSPVAQGTICFFNIHSHSDVPSYFSEFALFFCPSSSSTYSSFNAVFHCGPSSLSPRSPCPPPGPCCQAFGSCPGAGMGLGASKGLPGGFQATLAPLPLERVGFSMPDPKWGDKQKEEAELSKELDRGDVFCRKGCMSNREQTLLEGVFNIWLAHSHSLEVYSYFIIFFFWLAFSYFP